ncbi:EpsI domain-containing exosortase [Acidihalobacter ferrooxydans]|uniref:EpsI family protein n=1 Tax=Acidihalobacter ferrooxydans TaxID=1765967 RepID=A0A1P8UI35_9GAMM|nr:EpsI domain-containing exosortase [Acidihalobacter ferrooxydans]APZ43489.1 EpsI family protein [Acidihalobacter ferrooxydans]
MNAATLPLPNTLVRRGRWYSHVVFMALVLVYLAVFHTSLLHLTQVWAGDGTFQYAFLIIPITLFLIWDRRHATSGVPFAPSVVGIGLILALGLLWMLGTLGGVQQVQQFALIAILPAMVLGVYGTAVVRALLFPLAYLFFAVPWPVEHLITVLQHITAVFAVKALQMTGFIVYLDGVLIETPVAVWHVEVACSGIKFFIAMVALSLLYARMFFHSRRRRLVFVALAFIVPIISNGLRVYFTILIGETFGVQYATGTDHMIFGWQFFGTVLLLYFLAGWPWREAPPPEQAPRPLADTPRSARVLAFWAPVLLLSLLAGPAIGSALIHTAPRPALDPPPAARLGIWRLAALDQDVLGAHFHHAQRLFVARYRNGRAVDLVRADYLGPPRHGRKLFMVGNRWYDKALWHEKSARGATAKTGSGKTLHVREVALTGVGKRLLVWYWYSVNGRPTPSILRAKLWQLESVLRLQPLRTRMTVIATAYRHDPRAAAARLAAFARALSPPAGAGS